MIRSKHTKHHQLQKSNATTFTLYFSQQFFKKSTVGPVMISGANTHSAGARRHTHIVTEKPWKIPSFPPSHNWTHSASILESSHRFQLHVAFSVRWTLSLGGVETGSTGHCGRPPLLVQVWPPSGSRPEMQFLLHLVCALLTDVNQTQPKLTSLWIITHHSQQRWQPIAFFDAALVCLLDIDSINPRNKNPDVLRPSKTLITENRN